MSATAPGVSRAANVPTAAAPKGVQRVFFPEFEGLRAVAALLVVMVHTAFASGYTLRSPLGVYTARGEVGVSVFFLISGFLLYRPFVVSAMSAAPRPRLGHFWIRRVLRIVPLYWVALTVFYLVNGRTSVDDVGQLFQTYFFAQVYSKGWVLRGITQAWTLDIEVVFYLLLPVWALLLARRRRTAGRQLRVELVALAVVYLASTAFRWFALAHTSAGWLDTWHGWLPSWADMFALGMALAAVSSWYQQQARQPAWTRLPGADVACWVAAAAVYYVFSTRIGLSHTDPLAVGSIGTELAGHALYGLFAALLLLPAVFAAGSHGPVRRLLTWRPVAFVGLVSYGIYVWHQLVVQQILERTRWDWFHVTYWKFLPVALVAVLALSGLTYLLVERPGVGLGHRWVRRMREREAGLPARGGGSDGGGGGNDGGPDRAQERQMVEPSG